MSLLGSTFQIRWGRANFDPPRTIPGGVELIFFRPPPEQSGGGRTFLVKYSKKIFRALRARDKVSDMACFVSQVFLTFIDILRRFSWTFMDILLRRCSSKIRSGSANTTPCQGKKISVYKDIL